MAEIKRSGDFWVVTVEPGELGITATRTWPHRSTIGTINKRGTIRVWRPAGGAPRNWGQIAKIKLEDARSYLRKSGELADPEARKREAEELRSGSFLVELSDGRERRFNESKRAHDWAEGELRGMPNGSWAEFYRTGGGEREGIPWTQPFSVLSKDDYGRVGMSDIRTTLERRGARGPRKPTRDRSGSRAAARSERPGGRTSRPRGRGRTRRDEAAPSLAERFASLADYAVGVRDKLQQLGLTASEAKRAADEWWGLIQEGWETAKSTLSVARTILGFFRPASGGTSGQGRDRASRGTPRRSAPLRTQRDPASRRTGRSRTLRVRPDPAVRRDKIRVERGAGGNAMWHVPALRPDLGKERSQPFLLYWNGPGARLRLGFIPTSRRFDAVHFTNIDHPTADGNYRDFRQADRAARAFVQEISR